MASTTNNGWPKDPKVTRVYVGGDTDGAEFAQGSVAVVMKHFFTRFGQVVEPVRKLNGFRSSAFNASIPGSVPTSNHVSGTAGDVNGDVHPNEAAPPSGIKKSGFTVAQANQINALIANEFRSLIIWGGNTSTKFPLRARDFMHFEIAGSQAQIDSLAQGILSGESPLPPVIPGADEEDDVAQFTAKGPDGQFWHIAGVFRRPISSHQADALSVLGAPVPYNGAISADALGAFADIGGENRAVTTVQAPAPAAPEEKP